MLDSPVTGLSLRGLTKKGFEDDLCRDRIDLHVALAFVPIFVVWIVLFTCSFTCGEAFIGGVDRQIVASRKSVGEALCLLRHLIFAVIHIERDADHQCMGLPGFDELSDPFPVGALVTRA